MPGNKNLRRNKKLLLLCSTNTDSYETKNYMIRVLIADDHNVFVEGIAFAYFGIALDIQSNGALLHR